MRISSLTVLLAILVLLVPIHSYSEKSTNFVLEGNGFGTMRNSVGDASLQASLQIPESGKTVFQSGQFLLGDDTHSIKDMNLSLMFNKKLLRLAANSDDLTITASGRLVASAGDDLIYHINGKISSQGAGEGFSLFAVLKQNDSQNLGIAGILPQDTQVQNLNDLKSKQDILLLVEQSNRVQWKSQYEFTVKIFDSKLNPTLDFDKTSGYVNNVKISAAISNPDGQIIKTSSGLTKQFGIYEGSTIIPDNARTGTYTLNVTASGENFNTISKQFEFVVIPLNTS